MRPLFASCRLRGRLIGLITALLAWSTSINAATFLVGGDVCDHNNIQAAINAAASNPGADTIHVASNASYTAQALRIGGQDLTIIGGFANCAASAPTPGALTTISGAGGVADSVLVITGSGTRSLQNLLITLGDETSNGKGGGIDFEGGGQLTLSGVTVRQNNAGYGAGISFNGTAAAATLVLGANVLVQANVAANSGGGVRIEGAARLFMLEANSTISGNEARGVVANSGYGGGLQIIPPAFAVIGSSGAGGLGAISTNEAKYGGGVSVVARDSGGNQHGYVLLYAIDAQRPPRIDSNVASIAGGGVYLASNTNGALSENATLCAYEFRIDHNQAPDGAAIFLGGDEAFSASVYLNTINPSPQLQKFSSCDENVVPPPTLVPRCPVGVPCNRIDSNIVRQANGQPAQGAVITMQKDAVMQVDRVSWVGNQATDLIRGVPTGNSASQPLNLANCLMADNVLGSRLIANDGDTTISNCTIAGNTLGLSDVMSLTGAASISKSIIWQPGHVALGANHGPLSGFSILTNDPASLPLADSLNLNPRFIDPANGDYHLRTASPAIDVAVPIVGNEWDLDFLLRDQDLLHPNRFGSRDLGAYERPGLLPIVLNEGFDTDLRHWTAVGPNVSSFDASTLLVNSLVPGPITFTWLEPRVQCAHLPIAGPYRLQGWARIDTASGNTDTAILRWEFRRDGGEACNNGPPDSSGELVINNGADALWHSAFTNINVSQFTDNSSITVYTRIVNGGTATIIRGWFDDIDLTLDNSGIFKDSFE